MQVDDIGWDDNSWGSVDEADLIDMNNDGLLDLVVAPLNQPDDWYVAVNDGHGFTTLHHLSPPIPALRYTRQNDDEDLDEFWDEIIGIYDMNGDGLPDQVFVGDAGDPGTLEVYLNGGNFDFSPTADLWSIPGPLQDTYVLRRKDAEDDIFQQLLDVNGDGLADLVNSSRWSSTGGWEVALNRGDGFSSTVLVWVTPSPLGVIREANQGVTRRDTFDVDGDGLPDHVDFARADNNLRIYRSKGGAWCPSATGVNCTAGGTGVAVNPAGFRPDLLVEVENGVGGQTALEYRPSTQWDNSFDSIPDLPFVVWTLTRITRDDGMCLAPNDCVNVGSHQVITDLTYTWGRFDSVNRQFRGFALVGEKEGASITGSRQGRLSFFFQTAALGGKLLRQDVYDAGGGGTYLSKPISRVVNTWECVDPSTGDPLACPTEPAGDVWVRPKKVEQFTFTNLSEANAKLTTSENHEWDQCGGKFYGNVAHSSKGEPSGSPRVHTHTDYVCKDNSAGYIVDKPSRVWVNASNDSTTLEEKWFFYDSGLAKGNLIRVESWLDVWTTGPETGCSGTGAGSKKCVQVTTDYDDFGNVESVTDHLGRVTSTTFDSATNIYPFIVTSPTGIKKATEYDPACGVMLSQSIAYVGSAIPAARSERQYDSFCRISKTALPDEDIDTAPHETYNYELGHPAISSPSTPARPSRASVLTKEPNALSTGGVRLSFALSDGLGRPIQQYGSQTVEGDDVLVATTWSYGANGKITHEYAPFVVETATPYATILPNTGFTEHRHDALGRSIMDLNPDETFRLYDHGTAWQTTAFDECFMAAACTGGKTVEIRDALGRVTERQLYQEGSASVETRTAYTYDELGRLTTSRQGAATLDDDTQITTTYDTLSRKLQVIDPDSGTWKYHYDAVGNLIVQDDPKTAHHVQSCYDGENRMIQSCEAAGNFAGTILACSGTGPCIGGGERVKYSYYDTTVTGADRLGRPSGVEDGSGLAFFSAYDLRGRLTSELKLVDPGGTFAATSATTTYAYDQADHVTNVTYPDGELVGYSYDGTGRVRQVRSTTHQVDYLSSLTYDLFGRPLVVTHGNGTADTRDYHDEAKNFRLESIDTKLGFATLLDYHYPEYTPHGLLTKIDDEGPKGPNGEMNNAANFTYDGLGRLKEAAGQKFGTPWNHSYDSLGNMTEKGPYTLVYSNQQKPHTPTQLLTTQLTHDVNGNRLSKGSHTYQYDYRDRLTVVEANGHDIEYRYDYSGRRVAKIVDGDTLTVYYSELMEASGGYVTKYYYAGDLLIATHRKENSQFASLGDDAVRVVTAGGRVPGVILFLRRDVQVLVASSLALLTVGLALAPWKRKRVVGIALRHGHVVGVALAFSVSTLPLPVIVRPAEAGCDPPPPTGDVFHYHVDHLGSTQLITKINGDVQQWVRYFPYGEIQGRFGPGFQLLSSGDERFRHEFTGYETELHSGLDYAGARFYDSELGMFLTHDPASQFANPYAYGPWNPINGTDPSGACWWDMCIVEGIIIASAIGATTAGIQALVNGASPVEAFKAASIGAAVGAATSLGLGVVGSTVGGISPALQLGYDLALTGAGAYSSVESFRSGNYVGGAAGAVAVAFGLYGVAKGAHGRFTHGTGGISQEQQLFDAAATFDQRFQIDGVTIGGTEVLATANLEPALGVQVAGATIRLPPGTTASDVENAILSLMPGGMAAVGGKAAAGYTAGQLRWAQRILAEHGEAAVLKSIKSIQARLDQHLIKLNVYLEQGGYVSSIYRELRNFEQQIDALKEVLKTP